MTARRVLVAGMGNVFLGDDGFGVEVASRLARQPRPANVRVLDAGIRARDLAYELVDGDYEMAILIDAAARGGAPGTLYVIEPTVADAHVRVRPVIGLDGHAMTPDATLSFVHALGGTPTRILILGCEPQCVDDGVGLSAPVSLAVDQAVGMVQELICA